MNLSKSIFLSSLIYCSMSIVNIVSAAPTSEDETAIMNAVQSMWTAMEEGDLEDYLQHIHQDYSLFGESDVYLHKGKETERRDIADFLSRAKVIRSFMHQPEITIRGDTAWLTYYWSDAGVSSGVRYTSRGKSTRIFVKEEGKWLCIHSHFTETP